MLRLTLDLLRSPDLVRVHAHDRIIALPHTDAHYFSADHITVAAPAATDHLDVTLHSPHQPIRWIHLRWKNPTPSNVLILGDHWERSYGDLQWRHLQPERPLPWYFLIHDPASNQTLAAGVDTGITAHAGSLAMWQVDDEGVNLYLDTRCGGRGVELTDRILHAATIRTLVDHTGSPFEVACALAKKLCPAPRLPSQPAYGANDWYYIYGKNSRDTVLRDTQLLSELSPNAHNRPFSVIDAGWQIADKPTHCAGGPWTGANRRFGDMMSLASQMRNLGTRPGLWMRVLPTTEAIPDAWRLPENIFRGRADGLAMMDPSIPEVRDHIRADVRSMTEWGYDLIKHDFSTWDIFGQWGFQMGASIMPDADWSFADRSRTSAEVVVDLYRAIREGAGDAVVIGCNTIGHLAAGFVELQRTGDDTSGRVWERTRKMGVNTLAFRMNQHNAFFACDADCVGLTAKIDWSLNRRWLELLAASGTPLFVSADPQAVGADQRAALRDAFAQAAEVQPVAEPLDWLHNTTPNQWRTGNVPRVFHWQPPEGAYPWAGY